MNNADTNKVLILYFTGTGNSKRIADIVKDVFTEIGREVTLASMTVFSPEDVSEYPLIGIVYPVYAFDAPRYVQRFIRMLPPAAQGTKTFLITAAAGQEGWALVNPRKLLEKKGYEVCNTAVVMMPENWVTFVDPPVGSVLEKILTAGEKRVKEIVRDFICGNNYKKSLALHGIKKVVFGFVRFAFHNIGIKRLWMYFRVNNKCTSCGICAQQCPVNAIKMVDEKPQWSRLCEQCMRCMNLCPEQAVEQLEFLGHASKRGRYCEPHFVP
ncbi:MAG: EFR1 family ferrodoxin [Elusimicrobiota bacterium]